MRIDLVLKYLCLARSRSAAKSLCDEGRVQINGETARAASIVHAGDRVRVRLAERTLEVEVVDVPARQASKAEAPRHYRALG
jgi:ribosomal 50S subunit-recycling heat shock protein